MSFDHDRLLAEIDEEVQRRRESGDIPADLERELDLVFARFAPVDALEADFEQVLTRAEQATFIDVIAPVESSRPVIPIFKKVVRKVVGWYMRYVAQQTTGFAHAITRAVRLLGERVDLLEQVSPLAGQQEARTMAAPSHAGAWASMVVERFTGVTGRVLHGDAADGAIVRALVEAGVDAYGVSPGTTAGTAGTAAATDIELRDDEVTVHLRALPDGALAGLVLSDVVDSLPLGGQLQLADLAVSKVAPGGTVVVISRDPRSWGRGEPDWLVDLSPGRPLHAGTWVHVLTERGFVDPAVVEGQRPEGLQPVPRGNAVLNENLELLNDVLFPPESYAVVVQRPE